MAEELTPIYAVRLPDFAGPLDVLLRLIERQELEISKVSLALVADQFLEYVAALAAPEPRVLASFLVVAAKLLFIKSEALLPRPPPPPPAGDEEEDVGAELVRRLEEYRAIQQAGRTLRERDTAGLHSYGRPANLATARRRAPRPPGLGLEGVTLGQLTRLVNRRLQLRLPLESAPTVIPHEITLGEKVAEIEDQLTTAGPAGRLAVWPLLVAARSRAEVVVTFMAVLELLRRRRVLAEQDAAFGEIWLRVINDA